MLGSILAELGCKGKDPPKGFGPVVNFPLKIPWLMLLLTMLPNRHSYHMK